MASVAFLRGVNVGGAKTFRPTEVAAALRDLDVTSVGAAGTFVVRADAAPKEVAARFAAALPFEADVMVVPGAEVASGVRRDPLGARPEGTTAFASVLREAPAKLPPFPLDAPRGGAWEVRVAGVEGPFALTLRRVAGGKRYPNEVVEKALGVRATTRTWGTMETLAKRLDAA